MQEGNRGDGAPLRMCRKQGGARIRSEETEDFNCDADKTHSLNRFLGFSSTFELKEGCRASVPAFPVVSGSGLP